MSGVVTKDGQWEHCNNCGKFVKLEDLLYEQPSKQFKCGRDLCSKCAKQKPRLV